jgi:hypothetical protein
VLSVLLAKTAILADDQLVSMLFLVPAVDVIAPFAVAAA